MFRLSRSNSTQFVTAIFVGSNVIIIISTMAILSSFLSSFYPVRFVLLSSNFRVMKDLQTTAMLLEASA